MSAARAAALQVAERDPLEEFVPGWLEENSRSPKTLAAYTATMHAFLDALRDTRRKRSRHCANHPHAAACASSRRHGDTPGH